MSNQRHFQSSPSRCAFGARTHKCSECVSLSPQSSKYLPLSLSTLTFISFLKSTKIKRVFSLCFITWLLRVETWRIKTSNKIKYNKLEKPFGAFSFSLLRSSRRKNILGLEHNFLAKLSSQPLPNHRLLRPIVRKQIQRNFISPFVELFRLISHVNLKRILSNQQSQNRRRYARPLLAPLKRQP